MNNLPSVLPVILREAPGRPVHRPYNWLQFHVLISMSGDNSHIRVAGRVGPGERMPLLPDAQRCFAYLQLELKKAGIPYKRSLENWPPLRVITFECPD